MTDGHVLLEMSHIVKEFPGVRALDDVTMRVRKGDIHAICGENGPGHIAQAHSADEWVALAQLVTVAETYRRLLTDGASLRVMR